MASPSIKDAEMKLDVLYATDLKQYIEHCKTIKELGYKVFRNGNGKHKLVFDKDALSSMFGGAFK